MSNSINKPSMACWS